jgi:hypothetical protein
MRAQRSSALPTPNRATGASIDPSPSRDSATHPGSSSRSHPPPTPDRPASRSSHVSGYQRSRKSERVRASAGRAWPKTRGCHARALAAQPGVGRSARRAVVAPDERGDCHRSHGSPHGPRGSASTPLHPHVPVGLSVAHTRHKNRSHSPRTAHTSPGPGTLHGARR